MKKNYWYFSGQYIYLCKHWSLGDTNDVRNSDISRKNFASKSLANVYTFLKAIPICLEKKNMHWGQNRLQSIKDLPVFTSNHAPENWFIFRIQAKYWTMIKVFVYLTPKQYIIPEVFASLVWIGCCTWGALWYISWLIAWERVRQTMMSAALWQIVLSLFFYIYSILWSAVHMAHM